MQYPLVHSNDIMVIHYLGGFTRYGVEHQEALP
jgi:hypothetical protein